MHTESSLPPQFLNVIGALSARPSAEMTFPDPTLSASRYAQGAESHVQLASLLSGKSQAEIKNISIFDHVFLVGRVHYNSDGHVISMRLQAYASKTLPIDEIVHGAAGTIDYFRLDYHPETPGKLLNEPPIHLHAFQNGSPRIPVSIQHSGNPILWFLEFLMFNYEYSSWSEWLEEIAYDINLEREFEPLVNAFKSGEIHKTRRDLYNPLKAITDKALQIKSTLSRLTFHNEHEHSSYYKFG